MLGSRDDVTATPPPTPPHTMCSLHRTHGWCCGPDLSAVITKSSFSFDLCTSSGVTHRLQWRGSTGDFNARTEKSTWLLMFGAGWIFISKENECYHIFSNSMEQRNIIGGACSLKKVPSMTHPIVHHVPPLLGAEIRMRPSAPRR